MKFVTLTYAGLMLVLSIAEFGLYGFDKRRAQLNARRIPEKTLHLLSLLGGWPGALAGQRFYRHKSRKVSFQIIFWLSVLLNLSVILGIAYLSQR